MDNPAFRAVTFRQVKDAYAEQARGLLDGGCDMLLVETIFDTLNAKAALVAIEEAFEARGARVPVLISVTITDRSGRTLSGQTVEAFWVSIAHAQPFVVGINCALGAREMRPFLADLARVAATRVSAYPNAGLPNAFGQYDETPAETAALLREFAEAGLVDVVGGCCGTTPDHIRAIAEAVAGIRPRRARTATAPAEAAGPYSRYAGLEVFTIRPDSNFTMIGERTNVSGSARFRRLIRDGNFGEAAAVALDQVRGGANIIDVNMDEGLLDAEHAMREFLHLIATEPEIARVPVMIDSSTWPVIEAGLQAIQGKGIVNSISLKEGEADFLHKARLVRRYGAAVVVMAFDEAGQADTVERKVQILQRAYGLLTRDAGFDPADIVMDPNVLAIGTGMEEHANYAVNFIEAARILKATCPGVRISGGISNLSFAFRGNDVVREAIHSAFLYHAIQAGLDMGIVNAGQLVVYEAIEPGLRERVEDLIFNRRPDATERLVQFAASVTGTVEHRGADLAWRQGPVEARLAHALVHGIVDFIEQDAEEARVTLGQPLMVIEGPLMDGMKIGRRSVRRRQDVPAAGGEERAGDEAGRRVPRAVHGGGEAAGGRRGAGARHDRAGHGEGRRPRHRQEHRGRGARVQQLPRGRPGRDGAGRPHPGGGRRRARVRRGPVRADHAVPRRDGAGGRGDAAARVHGPAAHRRRDDEPPAHGGEDRPGVRRPRRLRAGRLEGDRRRVEPAERDETARVRGGEPVGAGGHPRAAPGARRTAPAAVRGGGGQPPARRLGARGDPDAGVHRPPRRRRRVARQTGRVHRLDVLLLGVGAEGTLPRDPRARRVRDRPHATSTITPAACCGHWSKRVRCARGACTDSGRPDRTATTWCCSATGSAAPRSRASRCCASRR